MRNLLLAGTAILCVVGTARAQSLVTNPLIFPSAPFTPGDCVTATGPNSVTTSGSPCGTGGTGGGITGPILSTIGNIPTWGDGAGKTLVDSGIVASSLPTLGANNTWGGTNAYAIRPLFNGNVPWDAGNFTPADYAALAGNNTFTGSNTFTVRPMFGTATPYDTANLPAALAPYLLSATAASTYLTQASAASVYYPKTGGTLTGTVTAPALTLSAAAGTWKPISFNTGATQRWQLGSDNDGESGSNAGSDFSIFSYADNGAVLANNLHILRSTGVATFSARPMFGAGVPWDSLNLVAPLTSAQAAATYLTIAAAASTYTTPDEVNAALATFVTKVYADAHYLGIFTGQPVLGLGPFSNGVSGNSTAASFIAESGGGSTQTINLYPNATTGLAAPGFPSQAFSSMVQAGDTAVLSVANGLSTLVVGAGATNINSPAGIRFATASGGSIAMGLRPTFAGSLAWDAGNFNPANYLTTATATSTYLSITNAASTYLSQASAAATYLTQASATATYLTQSAAQATYATISGVISAYMPFTGGTFSGQVQFNVTPTVANQSLPVTDSSPDVPTTSWVQAVITNRVGTGPFIPLTGVGMGYDIQIGTQGPNIPAPGSLPSAYDILNYVFVRKVVFPASFAGSRVMALANATATTTLTVRRTGSVVASGTLVFAAGSGTGVITFSGAQTFVPGDVLTIFTNESTANPALADATLGGISGVLMGTIAQ